MLSTTVLLPTFNRAGLISQSIDSILVQTRPVTQLLVIDDGSDDDTADVVRGYGDRVQYLRQDNAGKHAALNFGLQYATGDLIWIFDDDDIAVRDANERMAEALEQNPDAGFSYGRCDKFFGDWPNDRRELHYAYRAQDRQALYVKLMEGFFLWQGAMLVRRCCFDAIGLFDRRMERSVDYEMALRLLHRFSGVGVPFVAFHQRHHAGVRGSRRAAIPAMEMGAAWRKYNRLIFTDVHRTHALEEFVLHPGAPRDKWRVDMLARIQRATIMARNGLWPLAIDDLDQAADIGRAKRVDRLTDQEIVALRGVFQPINGAILSTDEEARALRAALMKFPLPLRWSVRANLFYPVTYRLRRLSKSSNRAAERRQLELIWQALKSPALPVSVLLARRDRQVLYGVEELPVT